LEHRLLNGDIIRDAFVDLQADLDQVETVQAPEDFDDEGLSVHVFETATGHELLRFDMFGDDPHYHYIHPGVDSRVVAYDVSANGPMWEWVIRCVRDRLPQMLERADAPGTAASVDGQAVRRAADELERLRDEVGRLAAEPGRGRQTTGS
jgi:hypothetical protein